MVEIEFSVMEDTPGNANNLLPILQAFEKQHHIQVNLVSIPWSKGWAEIAKFGLYGNGPDVSVIGTTWVGSLASMQALRPFQPQEVRALGSAEAFFETSWRTSFLPADQDPWAIPWLGDVLVLNYWQDLLKKAGLEETATAFSSHESLVTTLEKLRDSGVTYPLSLTTGKANRLLHEAAGYIWAAGGDFLSADMKRVTFHHEAALQGLKKYFSLHPFISPESMTLPAGELFNTHQAAVTVSGTYRGIVGRQLHPEWNQSLGIAPVVGTPFVGGSSFVIWRYSHCDKEAFELIRFLSLQPPNIPASPHDHQLPVRREALNMPSVEQDIFHHTYLQALQTGRSFPTVRLWGSVEEKLDRELSIIWAELFANPKTDLETCLRSHLEPLAERLDLVFSGGA
jgi:multiple sugar transport system substrate-binding protein